MLHRMVVKVCRSNSMNNVSSVLALLTMGFIGAAFGRDLGPSDVRSLPVTAPTLTEAYGPEPLQVGELRVPPGRGPFPVAVTIHGGCFISKFESMRGAAPIASALAAKGVATWNIDYRALGVRGGGWPGTMLDWGLGADHLRALAKRFPLDLTRVIVVGHSAGATAALFIAGRGGLPADSVVRGTDPMAVQAAVAIDGPLDLVATRARDMAACGEPVLDELLGGTPAERPEHYAQVSAMARLPIHVQQFIVRAQVLSMEDVDAYKAAASARGDQVTLLAPTDGTHFNVIAPGEPQWQQVEALILQVVFPK
jgi:acetyl esterase/lipase